MRRRGTSAEAWQRVVIVASTAASLLVAPTAIAQTTAEPVTATVTVGRDDAGQVKIEMAFAWGFGAGALADSVVDLLGQRFALPAAQT